MLVWSPQLVKLTEQAAWLRLRLRLQLRLASLSAGQPVQPNQLALGRWYIDSAGWAQSGCQKGHGPHQRRRAASECMEGWQTCSPCAMCRSTSCSPVTLVCAGANGQRRAHVQSWQLQCCPHVSSSGPVVAAPASVSTQQWTCGSSCLHLGSAKQQQQQQELRRRMGRPDAQASGAVQWQPGPAHLRP